MNSDSEQSEGSDSGSDDGNHESPPLLMDDGDEEMYAARMEALEHARPEWEQLTEICEGCSVPSDS